jgi:hypothetical protein
MIANSMRYCRNPSRSRGARPLTETQARIAGVIDGLTTAYATVLNASRAEALKLIAAQIEDLKRQFNELSR